MHAAVKILLGLVLIVIGFGLFLDTPSVGLWNSMTGINWWNNFVIVLTGMIPPLLLLVGIFIVWLEADELGAEKEIKSEEKKEKMEEPEERTEKPAAHGRKKKK
jgi:predicted tellurium resistance membrane protein TerC